jgi:hypothetical protein
VAGIRITPRADTMRALGLSSVANRPWVIRDVGQRFIEPYPTCSECGHHEVPTWHLQLDADGTVMVSVELWDRFQTFHDYGGFEKVNVVSAPPDQTLAFTSALLMAQPSSFA